MSQFYRILRPMYMAYMGFANYFVSRIPSNTIRCFIYRHVYLMKIGKGTQIQMGCHLRRPRDIQIGETTNVHPGCFLDGVEGLRIGNNVDIGDQVMVWCGSHDVQSPDYGPAKVTWVIEDRVVIYSRAMLINGGHVGEGAVIGAGSVVTKSVPPYTIVAGNPARKIADRNRNLTYTLDSKFVNKSW